MVFAVFYLQVVRYIANGKFSAVNLVHDLTQARTVIKFYPLEAGKLVIVTPEQDVSGLLLNGVALSPVKDWPAPESSGKVVVVDVSGGSDQKLTSSGGNVPLLAWLSAKGSVGLSSFTLTPISM